MGFPSQDAGTCRAGVNLSMFMAQEGAMGKGKPRSPSPVLTVMVWYPMLARFVTQGQYPLHTGKNYSLR